MANGVVGSPPYPAWLCPPSGASVLKFPVEFSILWSNHRVGRGSRCSGPKTQSLAGPPAPAWAFLLCWKEPLGPVKVTSPVPFSRASSSPLWTACSSPCPALTTEPHVSPHTRRCSKQGHAEVPLLNRFLCSSVFQGAAPKRADAPTTSSWAQWSPHLADRCQGPGCP